MHMANELLSVPVAAGTLVIAAGGLGYICKKAGDVITSQKTALMGVLGAFIFAAQMINFQLPAMPGTSGHMVGAVLLAIILGPHLGAIVISSVVMIQCLIFQDGGLLALGCNIINMAIVPSYIGYYLYRAFAGRQGTNLRIYIGTISACIITIEAGAILVPVEAAISGVLVVPFSTFLITMLGVHLLVGLIEGLITVAVLAYIKQTRPDLTAGFTAGKMRISRTAVLCSFLVFAIITAGGLSLLACSLPDGLEWSYADRPDQPDFEPAVSNQSRHIVSVDDFQSKYSLMPDYTARQSALGLVNAESEQTAAGWTSLAGVAGSLITMAIIWVTAKLLRRRKNCQPAL